VKPGTTLTSIAEAFNNDCFIVSPNAPTSRARKSNSKSELAVVVTIRQDCTRALTTIPTRAKRNGQYLHRHIDEHPQFRKAGLKLASDVIGRIPRIDPIVKVIVKVFDGFGGLLVLRIHSSIDLFQDEVSSGFDQSANPSQHISEMGQLHQIKGVRRLMVR